jgi:hypothetical protein
MEIKSERKEIEVKTTKTVPVLVITVTEDERKAIAKRIMNLSWYSTKDPDLLAGLHAMFCDGRIIPDLIKTPALDRKPEEGDTVTLSIKEDATYGISVSSTMRDYDGKRVTIDRVDNGDDTFKIVEDDGEYWYAFDMIASF